MSEGKGRQKHKIGNDAPFVVKAHGDKKGEGEGKRITNGQVK